MTDARSNYDDEIDLFELFQTLWQEKWSIITGTIISVLIAGCFLLIKTPEYESRLKYNVDTLPPFYEADKALNDFKKMFYSKTVFEEWKKTILTAA
jgi:LPS O-antigen subunit length determinant protein (WzzB/FepE family)